MKRLLVYTMFLGMAFSPAAYSHGGDRELLIDNLIINAANNSYNVQLCSNALSFSNRKLGRMLPSYEQVGKLNLEQIKEVCGCFKNYSENISQGSVIDQRLVYINAVHYMLEPENSSLDIKEVEGVYSNYTQQNKDFKQMIQSCII